MQIFEKDKLGLQTLWRNDKERQRAQLILIEALSNSTELTAKNIQLVFEQLDLILEEQTEEVELKDRAL
jgi:hypothetical protein